MSTREWSIQEIARLTGTTSRTLRHYDAEGLLPPARIAHNGYRHYDEASLVRLQRILLLRELGLGLRQIRSVLAASLDEASALETLLAQMREERDRLARRIAAVESTIHALNEGEPIMAEKMFDGFDHTQYKEEVEERWGETAYDAGDRWWRAMSEGERGDWKQRLASLTRDWIAAAEGGADPASAIAQALAQRHVDWLSAVPGTPRGSREYLLGLGEMYVADPRFAANYATADGGSHGAEFVRDALRVYAQANLQPSDAGA